MALVIAGKTQCPLCGQVIDEDDEIVMFPPFAPVGHSLARFSDAGVHAACFERSPEKSEVERLLEDFVKDP